MPRTRTPSKTRSEQTVDKVLAEIEALKHRSAELAGWLADARSRFKPQALTEPEKYSGTEQAEAQQVAAYVSECEDGIREIDERIAEAWALAAGLSDSPDRLAGSDAEIEQQAAALESRRAQLERKRGTFRDDRHDQIDLVLAEKRARIEALLAGPVGAVELDMLVEGWSVIDPALAEAVHASIDAQEGFAEGSRASWEVEVQTLARQAERRRRELHLRAQERELSEAEAAKAQAEIALAEVET